MGYLVKVVQEKVPWYFPWNTSLLAESLQILATFPTTRQKSFLVSSVKASQV